MPLYTYRCMNEHEEDVYVRNYQDKDCETPICRQCGNTMESIIAPSNRMLYFEQGKPRVMNNLGPEPVIVRSHSELEKKMKERGLEFAGNRPGTKGAWI